MLKCAPHARGCVCVGVFVCVQKSGQVANKPKHTERESPEVI